MPGAVDQASPGGANGACNESVPDGIDETPTNGSEAPPSSGSRRVSGAGSSPAMATNNGSVTRSRPSWAHTDRDDEDAADGPAAAPASSARRERRPSFTGDVTGDEVTTHDQAALLKTVGLVGLSRPILDEELLNVCSMLREALALRDKYRSAVERETFEDSSPIECASEEPYDPFTAPVGYAGRHFSFQMRRGIFVAWEESAAHKAGLRAYSNKAKDEGPPAFPSPPSLAAFTADMARMLHITSDAAVNSFCYGRLQKLEARFRLHKMEHEQREEAEQRAVPHRDFYNVRKVDTHVHLAAAMNQKHLLRFIKRKVRLFPNEVVTKSESGQPMTLAEVFDEMDMTPYDLSIDALGMHTDTNTFCRFDKFNLKYNPMGKAKLRDIFLKTENQLNGRYFAEITQELFDDLAFSKYQKAEYRVSIYGRNPKEWGKLANWVVDHQLFSPHNRWVIQVPRLYGMYQANRDVRTFSEFLDNIFLPLFEASTNPDAHPKLHLMLQQVVGFDCVDDESKTEPRLPTPTEPAVHPDQWTVGNPHYAYYCYYLYANLHVLNHLRRAQGLSTFCFRPHAGEAGELNHLHAAFLTARGINHGINLRKSPSLQYLYYLAQVGLALSPLSNNALFLTLSKSPFHEFFSVGLNVSLSTDDPLMFHHTREPLMEEYTIAKQVWKLSSVDLSEIARNSVLQSSFEPVVKAFWIGPHYRKGGAAGNDIHRTNVPMLRCAYRDQTLREELLLVRHDARSPNGTSPLLAPSGAKAPTSPQRAPSNSSLASPARRASKYERYDGPHAMNYEPPPPRRANSHPSSAPSTSTPPSPSKPDGSTDLHALLPSPLLVGAAEGERGASLLPQTLAGAQRVPPHGSSIIGSGANSSAARRPRVLYVDDALGTGEGGEGELGEGAGELDDLRAQMDEQSAQLRALIATSAETDERARAATQRMLVLATCTSIVSVAALAALAALALPSWRRR